MLLTLRKWFYQVRIRIRGSHKNPDPHGRYGSGFQEKKTAEIKPLPEVKSKLEEQI